MKNYFEKVKSELALLLEDLKSKQFTSRVKGFIACLCSAVLLIAIIGSIFYVSKNNTTDGGLSSGKAVANDELENNGSGSEKLDDLDNNKESVEADENLSEGESGELEISKVLIPESADVGESYIDETLFIGDSNTVRMMNYGITSVDNTIAVVGMGIQSVKSLKCVQFSGYDEPVTMVEAVKLMQPRRIIITFGTNNANGMSTVDFATKYKEALEALNEAYPYADILINTIPPICENNSYPKLSQKSIDEFNDALYKLAEAMGCKLLDTASVMKNERTGYAKDNYTVNDGIHLSDAGFAAMFTYIRTHALTTGDSRPSKLAEIPKQIKETYVIDSSGKMNNDPDAYKKMSEVSKEQKEALKKAQEEALKAAEETQKKIIEQEQNNKAECKHLASDVSIVREATEDSYGIRRYTCKNCGYVYDEQIPKKQPQKSEDNQSSQQKQEHQHSYQKVGGEAAGPGKAGWEKFKCSCGQEYTNTLPALPVSTTQAPSEETPSTPTTPTNPEQPAQPEQPSGDSGSSEPSGGESQDNQGGGDGGGGDDTNQESGDTPSGDEGGGDSNSGDSGASENSDDGAESQSEE